MANVRQEGRLREIPSIGPGIAAAIEQTLESGTFIAHSELIGRFPESLIELTTIPGIGAKTAVRLFQELGIENLNELESALAAGTIRAHKGLGARTEATVRAGLELLRRRTGRIPLGAALPIAQSFMRMFETSHPQAAIHLAGSARRWDITVGDLDFVVTASSPAVATRALKSLPMVTSLVSESERDLRLELAGGIEADIFFTDPESLGSTIVRATGTPRHLEHLGEIPDRAATEGEIYAARGLPWIPPELRTGGHEFDQTSDIASLVTIADVRGELHAHTTWSDGQASIREIADAAAARDYEYLGITDHSHGLGVAGGLTLERLTAQRGELDTVNRAQNVMLLAGAEVEVHRDGSLDFDDETLANLDVVVASLHSGLRQPQEELTSRLRRVLENPNVDIIAHPSGRLIERREGGDFDWDQVFTAAARSGTALEINADPARLDLDPALASRARAAGCLLAINCDAHSGTGFAGMAYGIAMARKAWLKPEQILNCWTRERVLDWLTNRGTLV